jgi:hypothetical protein
VAILAAAFALLVPARAGDAHGTIDVRTVLDRVEPDVPGLRVQVVVGISAELIVENRTPEVLEVLDDIGNPFMRIGPQGVEGDFTSPVWLAVNAPNGVPDQTALPTGSPRWERVTTEPVWGWFDHRMHPGGTISGTWEVPMRLGTRTVTVHGRVAPLTGQGAFVPILRSAARPTDGLLVAVLPGRIPGIYLQSERQDVVTVVGRDGKPFARIGPNGVEVDAASPTWAADRKAQGHLLESIGATGWQQVDTRPTLAWLDDRGLWPEGDPPRSARAATKPVDILEWEVPLDVAGAPVVIKAVTQWVPFVAPAGGSGAAGGDGGGRSFPWAPVAVGAAAIVLVVGRWRFTRRRQVGATEGP